MHFIIIIVVIFIIILLFQKRDFIDTQLLISALVFAGIGFAIGEHYQGLGWGVFGAALGLLIGIEVKETLFKVFKYAL